MPKTFRSAMLQGVLFVCSTVLAFAILVRTDIVRQLAYMVEKGRIEAMKDTLPDDDELAQRHADVRRVAAIVTPAVVQILTERRVNLTDLLELHQRPSTGGDASSNGVSSNGVSSNGVSTNGAANALETNPEFEAFLRQHRGFNAREGYGSGFIVDAERGIIVTNDHVIDHADTIHVNLADGRLVKAKLLGADPRSDLAVLQIDAKQLYELALAPDDAVEVGDTVMSVGNPFGLEGSVSRGIVSAKARSNISIQGVEYRGFIQTDAVINPGNSGGPLVNLRGEVVAINTAIATETGHYDGVGFAIPAQRIRKVLPALIRGEEVPRGYLGVVIADAPPAKRDDGSEVLAGVVVRDVLEDSPARRYGLREGDIIEQIDGVPLRHTPDLIDLVGDSTPGTSLAFTVRRGDAVDTMDVIVGRQPSGFSTRQRVRE
jgi:S1-C subfamily serine protease